MLAKLQRKNTQVFIRALLRERSLKLIQYLIRLLMESSKTFVSFLYFYSSNGTCVSCKVSCMFVYDTVNINKVVIIFSLPSYLYV